MAIKRVDKTSTYNIKELIGLSTDTKPTDCDPGSTFYEMDTKNGFIWDGTQWWPV